MEYEDRNPSPPPGVEALTAETTIGDTVFSKSWLFQCLLDVIKYVEDEATLSEDEMRNLDEGLERSLCTLWDMSANQNVSGFLLEFKAPEMFVQIIASTKTPRLLEIVIGILGNMCSFNDVCEQVTKTDRLSGLCLWLLGSTDTPTLLQLNRLLLSCVTQPSSKQKWMDEIRENLAPFVDQLQTILSNTLNGDLVSSTLKLVDRVSDIHSDISIALATLEFVKAMNASVMQLLGENEVLGDYWHILYNLEMETQFAAILEPLVEDFITLLKAFIMTLPEDSKEDDGESKEYKYQQLCLCYSFLANLSNKARHAFFDDSGVSDYTFACLDQLRREENVSEYGEMLATSLTEFSKGITHP